MKVLFTDLDGVCNGHESHADCPYTIMKLDCMRRLNRVILETDCRIIISSAWRYMLLPANPPMTLVGFEYMLNTHGFVATGTKYLIGHTCSDEQINSREEQILKWIWDNKLQTNEWAVVDDMKLNFGEYQDRFVKTHPYEGLQDADADKLIALLGKV